MLNIFEKNENTENMTFNNENSDFAIYIAY